MRQLAIMGCNNNRCIYWEENTCKLPDLRVDGREAIQHFDYDHFAGKLFCRMCLEDNDE